MKGEGVRQAVWCALLGAVVIVLASTSPQRRAILEQLRIPFEVVAPSFDEETVANPLARAAGKARSVDGRGRPVLGVDTEVVLETM